MPSVVMNDGTRSFVVISPLARPVSAPASSSPPVTATQEASGYEP